MLGLEAGADDYVTKPYSPRELRARVTYELDVTVPCGGPRCGRAARPRCPLRPVWPR